MQKELSVFQTHLICKVVFSQGIIDFYGLDQPMEILVKTNADGSQVIRKLSRDETKQMEMFNRCLMFNRWKKKEFEIVIEDIILLREILILGEYGFRKLQKFFQITEMNVDFQKVFV